MVKLFSKNSNLCDHNSPTSQTDRRTDRQTTCDRNIALCTKVHRAVKTMKSREKENLHLLQANCGQQKQPIGSQQLHQRNNNHLLFNLELELDEDHTNSRRYPGFPGGLLNSSRFPGVVDTLDFLNNNLLSRRRNVANGSADVTWPGRWFQVWRSSTRKVPLPTIDSLMGGTTRRLGRRAAIWQVSDTGECNPEQVHEVL